MISKFKNNLTVLLCLIFSLAIAQQNKNKIDAYRVGFITNKLELSPTEAEKFWPLYNEYQSKMKTVRNKLKNEYKSLPDKPTEKEAQELFKLDIKSKQEELDLYKIYSDKLVATIGLVKLAKLRIAEYQFRREMLKAME